MSTAYLFPGQGSQFVGMGKDHYENNEAFEALCNRANDVLGIDLTAIMFEGPEEKLKQTEFTQPAIFLHSVALFHTLDAAPDMVAGHSLGEFSALVACGALDFESALKIVRKRGQLMQQAGTDNPGTMAAIIGMDDEAVEAICADASDFTGKEAVAANYNCPGQLVISGYVEAVEKAIELASERGARMAKLLPVSGAFHSSLMQPAFDGLKTELEKATFNTANCPVYSNYTAKPTIDPEEIRSNVLDQLLNPVRWTQTIQGMIENGATSFVEVGPGRVLQGLVKRTNRKAEISGHQ
jgi:[acyl-carrier-protein] S-malonyltransferase